MEPVEAQLARIEKKVDQIAQHLGFTVVKERPAIIPSPAKPLKKIVEKKERRWLNWLLENWPAKLGILLVLMGACWFLHYAFTHQWLSDAMRFALCLTLSTLIFGAGIALMPKRIKQGHLLVGLGAAGILLTLWSGYTFFNILSPQIAFLGMSLTIVISALLSLRYHSQSLAALSVVTAFVILLMLPELRHNNSLFMGYLLIIDLFTVWVLLKRGWTWTMAFAVFGTAIYDGLFVVQENSLLNKYYAFCICALFVIPWAYLTIKSQKRLFIGSVIVTVAIASLFEKVLFLFDGHERAVIELSIAIALLLPSLFLKKYNPLTSGQTTMGCVWGLAITTAIAHALSTLFPHIDPVAFRYVTITIALLYALLILNNLIITRVVTFFFITPLLISAYECPETLYSHFNDPTFWSLVAGFVCPLLCSLIIFIRKKIDNYTLGYTLIGLSALYALALIWNLSHNLIASPDAARGTALVIYTALGIILQVFSPSKLLRRIGLAIILGVICRLLFLELHKMPVLMRISTFIATGTLLVASAFLDRRQTKKMKSELSR